MFFFILGFIITIILIYKNEWNNNLSFKRNIEFMDWGFVFLVGIMVTIVIPMLIIALSLPFLLSINFQMDLELEARKRLQPLDNYENVIYLEKFYYTDEEDVNHIQYKYSTEFYTLGNQEEILDIDNIEDKIRVFVKFDEFDREPPILYIYKAIPKNKVVNFLFLPIVKTYYSFVIPAGTALEVN